MINVITMNDEHGLLAPNSAVMGGSVALDACDLFKSF